MPTPRPSTPMESSWPGAPAVCADALIEAASSNRAITMSVDHPDAISGRGAARLEDGDVDALRDLRSVRVGPVPSDGVGAEQAAVAAGAEAQLLDQRAVDRVDLDRRVGG